MDAKNKQSLQKKWSSIVEKAWKDDNFKKRLLTNPSKVLKEEGIELAENININVFEDTKQKKNFILSSNPRSSNNNLKHISGGAPTNKPPFIGND